MRSIYFADNEQRDAETLLRKSQLEDLDNRGFLAVAVVMFVIYAVATRPILYAQVGKWLSQIF